MNRDDFQQNFDNLVSANIQTARKTVRRTALMFLAVNFGCLLFSVAGITVVILACLKLFGVI